MTRYQKNREKIKILTNFLAKVETISYRIKDINPAELYKMVTEAKAKLWEIENASK